MGDIIYSDNFGLMNLNSDVNKLVILITYVILRPFY